MIASSTGMRAAWMVPEMRSPSRSSACSPPDRARLGSRAFVALQLMLGQLLSPPDAVQAVSLFWHLAEVPSEDFATGPAAALVLLAPC
jgi:hypothetical protein